MDAPIYAPATRFVQPVVIPQYFSTAETSISRLRAHPDAWAIILKQFPNIDARTSNEMIKPHLDNFSLRSLTQFGIVSAEGLDVVDVQLRALGEVG